MEFPVCSNIRNDCVAYFNIGIHSGYGYVFYVTTIAMTRAFLGHFVLVMGILIIYLIFFPIYIRGAIRRQ